MLTETENVLHRIRGVKGTILMKGREIVLSEFDDAQTKQLSDSMYYLVSGIEEAHNFQGILISAENGRFFVFNRKNFFLGVLSGRETNLPVLKLFIKRGLLFQEPEVEIEEEIPDEIEIPKEAEALEEEVPFFLKISCSDYYKKYSREPKKK